jgi:quercetin dioxygenase-like cupin family protein
MEARIDFTQIDWLEWMELGTARMKIALVPGTKLRLIEFPPGFEQISWCESGHIGYVVEGVMETIIEGDAVLFKKGDALVIRAGMKHRSRNIGEQPVLLFLVDDFERGSAEVMLKAMHAAPPEEIA